MAGRKVLTKEQIVAILMTKEAYKDKKSSVLMKERKEQLLKRLDEFRSIEPVKELEHLNSLTQKDVLKNLGDVVSYSFSGKKVSLTIKVE